MRSPKAWVILFFQLVFLVAFTVQDDMCGVAAPDPAKTCISIRLPWNPTPMYFCTDKSTFRYKNQCQNRFTNQCGLNTIRQDTLMVASPWDCCPLVSFPDSCVNQQCPPAPLNRNCQTMEPGPNQPWECCNSYFCEENMTPETCHFKRLEPSCNMPPQGKTNCVSFVDPYGCCPKFQCDGEGKAGHCPAQSEAMKFMTRFNSTNMLLMGPGGPMMMPPGMAMRPGMGGMAGAGAAAGQAEMHLENKPADAAAQTGESAPSRDASQPITANAVAAGGFISIPNQQNLIACINDNNCPGTMKCCSNDMNVYMTEGHYFFRNVNPTYGYCMEPATSTQTNIRNLKYTV